MTNVLIVEDEPAISDMERDFLEGTGYNPFIAENSEEALHMMRSEKIDAVILDVTLPGEDGFSLCRKLREITNVPILFAAARTEDSDIVRGLGLGADDYLLKPLKGTILIAHLRAQLSVHMRIKAEQLNKSMPEEGITIGDLIIRPKARQVILNDKIVLLTGKEFDLLYFLATHPNEVFSKEQLFEQIWSLDPIGEPATVTVHINRLRAKLKKASGHAYERIETVWGSGYRFHGN